MYPVHVIAERLAAHQPRIYDADTATRQAAVAVILRDANGAPATSGPARSGTDILFIQRAVKRGDPWSGHMAFPGGHKDPTDPDLKAAAMRETWEEIGLDLADAAYLGALDQQQAMPRGRPLDMLIAPHVFAIAGDPEFHVNHEVAEVVWTDLEALVAGTNHDTETLPVAGKDTVFNGYRLERGHFVWGLTYRMLKTFFAALDPAWEPPPEL